MKVTILDVKGMTCGSCIRHINTALGMIPTVAETKVDLGAGKVVVRHDIESVPVERLIAALDEAGYQSREAD